MTEEVEEATEEITEDVTVTDEVIAGWTESESELESPPSGEEETIDALLDEWGDASDDSDEEWGENTFTEEPQSLPGKSSSWPKLPRGKGIKI